MKENSRNSTASSKKDISAVVRFCSFVYMIVQEWTKRLGSVHPPIKNIEFLGKMERYIPTLRSIDD